MPKVVGVRKISRKALASIDKPRPRVSVWWETAGTFCLAFLNGLFAN